MTRYSKARPRAAVNIKRRTLLAASALPALWGAGAAFSNATANSTWPEPGRTIRLVVGYSPGGGTDVLARLIAERLAGDLQTTVVVENRAGAAGTVAANLVSNARPDGYTLLFSSDPELTIAPVVLESMPYDPFTDLTPVSHVARGPYVIVAHPRTAAKSLDDLIAYAAKNPGKVNFGSSGAGTSSHLLGEQFGMLSGVQAMHIPYKGLSAAVSDLVAGHIDYAFVPPLVARSFIEANSILPLAIAAPERHPNLASVPTTAESGFPQLVGGSWYALLGPAGLPANIVTQLERSISTAIANEEAREAIARLALIPEARDQQGLKQLMRDENQKWKTLVAQLQLPK